MLFFESLLVALSTYSTVPVPQFEWNERNMKYAICFLPAVGIICAVILFLWYKLCLILGVSALLFSAVAVCLPLLISGGIHMDGYMDTVDALASHQSPERKLEIMKDPHCGAFAVIYCGVYLLAQSGFMYELYSLGLIAALCPVFVLSRALAGICAVNIPNARKKGMLYSYTKDTQKHNCNLAFAVSAILAALAVLLWAPLPGVMALAFALMSLLFYKRLVMKNFGGATGDTTGFFLQVCEFALMLGLWTGGVLL